MKNTCDPAGIKHISCVMKELLKPVALSLSVLGNPKFNEAKYYLMTTTILQK